MLEARLSPFYVVGWQSVFGGKSQTLWLDSGIISDKLMLLCDCSPTEDYL